METKTAMIGSTTGAPQSLRDTFHIPPRSLLSRESHSRRRLAATTSISAPRFHRPTTLDLASAKDLKNLNSLNIPSVKRIFFLDVNPICYDGSRLDLHYFARWISLFFDQVSLRDPVVAVRNPKFGPSSSNFEYFPCYISESKVAYSSFSLFEVLLLAS